MKVKLLLSIFFAFILLFVFALHCSKQANPLSTGKETQLDVQLSFVGSNISKNPILKKSDGLLSSKSSAGEIVAISVKVLDSDLTVLNQETASFDPETRTFESNIKAEAGTGKMVEVEVTEQINCGENTTTGLTWYGQKNDVSIIADSTTTVAIDLYPLPVQGCRVVLFVDESSGTVGTSNNIVNISLANLDNLRGIQMDLLYDQNNFNPENAWGIIRCNGYKLESQKIEKPGQGVYRMILFDENKPLDEIVPVTNPKGKGEDIVSVSFQIIGNDISGSETIDLKDAIVTTANYDTLQVYAVANVLKIN